MAIQVQDEGRLVDLFQTPFRLDALITQRAIEAARTRILRNLSAFGTKFPASSTVRNQYPLNRASISWDAELFQPPGANTGWTSGFWSGLLWLINEATGESQMKPTLERHITSFHERVFQDIDLHTHALGLLYGPSCMAAWKLAGSQPAREAALLAAERLLAMVFEPAGIIQAWGRPESMLQAGRLTVDSLMNLPLLFWAGTETGDDRFARAARKHAAQAARHLVRADGAIWDKFRFDAATGEPLHPEPHQSFSEDSCWARGQAWAIYGFALSGRHAQDQHFLEMATACANYFLNHAPKDLVPYWDLSFEEGSRHERDSSAAAITACGLLELARQLHDPEAAEYFTTAAHRLAQALIEHCMPPEGDSSQAVLLHGVYARKLGLGVDEGNLWGDYFFLEALSRVSRPWNPHW